MIRRDIGSGYRREHGNEYGGLGKRHRGTHRKGPRRGHGMEQRSLKVHRERAWSIGIE